jgi:hypothetical protein
MTIKSNGGGHGGRRTGTNWMDPGAVGNGRREADVVRTITQKMQAIANVRDTTDNNATTVNQNLQNQVTLMNAAGSGVAITSHLNAFNGQATGVEVFYWAGNEQMRILAVAVSKAIADALGIVNRGAKPTTTFFVHRNTNMGVNVLLIEWCFIDNKNDMDRLDRHMDAAIHSVMNVLGYKSSSNTNTNTNEPSKIEKIIGGMGMFIYWQPQATGGVSDAFGVWGNKRFHIAPRQLDHFRAIVRNATGEACREYRWARGSDQIKTVESFTELQRTVL